MVSDGVVVVPVRSEVGSDGVVVVPVRAEVGSDGVVVVPDGAEVGSDGVVVVVPDEAVAGITVPRLTSSLHTVQYSSPV